MATAQATVLDRNDPRGWFLLGKNTIQMGDAARAVNDYLVRALTLQNQLQSEQGQAETLNALQLIGCVSPAAVGRDRVAPLP